ncbi:MAG TPA: hypothetical protein VM695_12350 [Phycisphaerae bacterium]|nr:hypothetical protein [Phycisphaerae bacterium]
MPGNVEVSSSWVYPDRDAWEKLLHLRPKPRPVMDKPPWWRTPWPLSGSDGGGSTGGAGVTQLNRIRNQLAWAEKCLLYAQSVLPDGEAKGKAYRLAEELRRTRLAFDTPAKAQGTALAADELVAVGRYDPVKYPRPFIEAAGRGVTAAGQVMSASACPSVAYWGRVLVRAGGYFRAMKPDLPGG